MSTNSYTREFHFENDEIYTRNLGTIQQSVLCCRIDDGKSNGMLATITYFSDFEVNGNILDCKHSDELIRFYFATNDNAQTFAEKLEQKVVESYLSILYR